MAVRLSWQEAKAQGMTRKEYLAYVAKREQRNAWLRGRRDKVKAKAETAPAKKVIQAAAENPPISQPTAPLRPLRVGPDSKVRPIQTEAVAAVLGTIDFVDLFRILSGSHEAREVAEKLVKCIAESDSQSANLAKAASGK